MFVQGFDIIGIIDNDLSQAEGEFCAGKPVTECKCTEKELNANEEESLLWNEMSLFLSKKKENADFAEPNLDSSCCLLSVAR